MNWLNPAGRTGRFLAFYIVLAIPLLRVLLSARYELWRPEVLALLALFALPCLALAFLPGGKWSFYALLAPWAAFFATSGVKADLFPTVSLWWVFAGLTMLTAGGIALFRERFPLLMAILLIGMFAAEAALVAAGSGIFAAPPPLPPTPGLPHAIYLVLDEQTGIAGFPKQIPACAEAARVWLDTLSRHGFTVYPNAYSNYNLTQPSLASVLNDSLLNHGTQFQRRNGMMSGNVLFGKAVALGMSLAVYQSGYIRFNHPGFRYAQVREYDPGDVSALMSTAASWSDKTRHLAVWYGLINRPLGVFIRRYFPRAPESIWIGPLSIRKVWPQTLLQDILAADRPTLFYAHLLAPHYPYVFDAKGKVLPLRDWPRPLSTSPEDTDRRYRAYCAQSTHLAHQLKGFLGQLQQAGMLRNAQIFLHGDHGARVSVTPNMEAPHLDPVKTYAGNPTLASLLDSYSAMLAVRMPGQKQPPVSVDPTKGSLIYLLRKIGGRTDEPGAEINKVYVLGLDRSIAASIPILDYWKELLSRAGQVGIYASAAPRHARACLCLS